ncbi:arsenic resistance protein [Halorhodospira halophila]|uniref:arsenic resistance protein n=1 Tax=Halorhodospira halophila TaxID=1053 RepID=UPI0019117CEC|nr:bile acid:sodium symporter [Halorhodospira halophila]MBK5937486.1 arsenite transporter [Halorhodospira halophila]
MWSILYAIQKRLTWAIPAMLVLGFLYGALLPSDPLRWLVLPLTFLMVYPMMVTLRVSHLTGWEDLRAQLLTQGVNFAVIPFIAFGLGLIFFTDQPYMALGLLLAGLVPTSGMTISWTGFAGGNLAAAVKMTVIGLLLGALATPFYVEALLGAQIHVDLWAIAQQVLVIVVLPLILGVLTQRALVRRYGQEDFRNRWAFRFPALSTLGVLGIVFIAMALNAETILAAPERLLYILAPVALLYAINFPLSTLLGKALLPRGDAIALVYGSVMRNLSIALAIAMNAFGAEGANAALVIAIAFVIQVQAAAWYVRLTRKVFGPPEDEIRQARQTDTAESGNQAGETEAKDEAGSKGTSG